MRKEKGITLIALIITIIVLLILAGVSISMIASDDGIISQATVADEKAKIGEVIDNVSLAWTETEMYYWQNSSDMTKSEAFVSSNLNSNLSEGKITNVNYQEDGDSTLIYTDTKNNLAYTVKIDKSGNVTIVGDPFTPEPVELLSKQISEENYGDKVANYSMGGVNDWSIFYEDDGVVYIIASDYMPNAQIPAESGLGAWGTGFEYRTTWLSYPTTTIAESVISKFMLSGLSSFNTETVNYKATAGMLDTAKWKCFVNNTFADYAIGSPTLDMWMASWNAKYDDSLTYSPTQYGYQVGYSEDTIADNIPKAIMIEKDGYKLSENNIYFPRKSAIDTNNQCYGYWIASPSNQSGNGSCMMYIDYCGYIGGLAASNGRCALRPVVALKDSINAVKTDAGWILSE